MKDFSELKLDFFQFFTSIEQMPKMNKRTGWNKSVLVGKFLKTNKRTGNIIPDSRVPCFTAKFQKQNKRR